MKESKRFQWISVLVVLLLCGCGKTDEVMKVYDVSSQQSEFSCFDAMDFSVASSFASKLCVVSGDNTAAASLTAEVASIYNISEQTNLYSKNVHARMNPASITKVMTVLLALEYGNMDDVVIITDEAMISESGATLLDLHPGDQITMENLVKASMVKSANDAAAAIAVHIGESLEGFVDMMNKKALELGATNTHFTNPHGLTDEEHYTTAYDLYLILNKASEYSEFLDLVQMKEAEIVYMDEAGNPKSVKVTNSNRYINGGVEPPDGVVVVGGKTGTTNAAGSCLALLSKNAAGKWFCSVILKADSSETLFREMNTLLGLEN
ncbi:MAG: serine hydrolase [Lachnospiraceae bacterium]|nr:serine hydrolase [Lachnospiraceae bacterium]